MMSVVGLATMLALQTSADLTLSSWMLCAETVGLERRIGEQAAQSERAAILQIALDRALKQRSTLPKVLLAPRQFSTICPAPLRRSFLDVTARLWKSSGLAPRWANDARAFAAPHAAKRVEPVWRRRGFVRMDTPGTVHVFFGRAVKIARR